jgi:RNA polymerase sigma-70 factor (ECF subfamily)
MTAVTVEALIIRGRGGDTEALGELFARYRNYLRLLARVQLNHPLRTKLDPSDLVQEVFLQAYRQFASLHGDSEQEFLAWQHQILLHNLLDRLRHFYAAQKRDVRLETSLEDSLAHSSKLLRDVLVDPKQSPIQSAEQREQSVLVANALEQLPAHYRDVLAYRHLQELPFEEVAKRMDRSLDSVEKLWVRALAAVRAQLGRTVFVESFRLRSKRPGDSIN